MTKYVFGGGIERVVTYQFDNSLTHSKAPRSSAVVQNRSKDLGGLRFHSTLRNRSFTLCSVLVMRHLPFFPIPTKSSSFAFSVLRHTNVVVEHV